MKHLYMYKNFALGFLAFFLILPKAKTQNKPSTENFLLWEISGNGLKKPSYLFGTYHLLTDKFIDSFPVINQKFNAAEALVCEASFDQNAMNELNTAMVLNGTTLEEVMKPEDYKLVSEKVQEIVGIDMAPFQTYKPMTVLLLMYQIVHQRSQPNTSDAETGMDLHLQNVASQKKKDIYALEDTKTQIETLYGQFTIERQSEMLVDFMKNINANSADVLNSVECYKKQDLQCLTKMIYGDDYKKEEIYNLLDARNIAWMKLLPNLITKQSCFIAVGAGHLIGENGLLNLLRKQGYTIKPVALK